MPADWSPGTTSRYAPAPAFAAQWVDGSRRPAHPCLAAAPRPRRSAGTGGRRSYDGDVTAVWWKAALALVVALALQVGVNYANDYSDGIRGTDEDRVGPLRLVGSGVASPRAVKRAAFAAFGVAAAGRAGARRDDGVVAGRRRAASACWRPGSTPAARAPYGYRGLGEVMVFVFFGLVAVVGTTYVQTGDLVALGAALVRRRRRSARLACAILVANNLRDIPTDTEAGKRTLAVVLGDARTRLCSSRCSSAARSPPASASRWRPPWALLGAGRRRCPARAPSCSPAGRPGGAWCRCSS